MAASLRSEGQLQPIRVRWSDAIGKWIIVSGERRWRAAQQAGMTTIDCVFDERQLQQADTLAQQLIENLMREDLLPMEQAHAFQDLIQLKGWSGKQVADALHIPASKVSRTLALLDLPLEVQERVAAGQLAARSAYELSKLPDTDSQIAVANQVVEGKLTQQETATTVKCESRKTKPKRQPGGAKVEFWADNGWKITVSSKAKGNYHEVRQALEQALEEAELRIRSNINIL
jgi:ParB family chromosome partitioning protein